MRGLLAEKLSSLDDNAIFDVPKFALRTNSPRERSPASLLQTFDASGERGECKRGEMELFEASGAL